MLIYSSYIYPRGSKPLGFGVNEMNSSVIIAQLIGPTMLLMGISLFTNIAGIEKIGREFMESRALIMMAGMMAFIPGLAIVNFHNIWIMAWPVVVTLFGWLLVVAGIMRIIFYDQLRVMGKKMLGHSGFIKIAGAFLLILGGFLSYKGYFYLA